MQNTTTFVPTGDPARFCLSVRGFSTNFAYQTCVATVSERPLRSAVQAACVDWADAHGLEPQDGAYLRELEDRPLTLNQLGEALAVSGQTREMIVSTVTRLVGMGFVEEAARHLRDATDPLPRRAADELSVALVELERVRDQFERNAAANQRLVVGSLRRAIRRVVSARNYLEALSRAE